MKVFLFAVIFFIPLTCQAGQILTSAADGRNVFMTIYNNGDAFVVERRIMQLAKGDNEIIFKTLPEGLQEDSVHVENLSPGVVVTQQAVSRANRNRRTIAQRFVNKAVKAVSRNTLSGEDKVEDAVLLGVDDGYLLRIGDRIETDFPGRLVFPNLPEDLHGESQVRLAVMSKEEMRSEFVLSYMLQSVNWQAEYTGMLGPADDKLHLGAWARINNLGNDSVEKADTYLVAGALHRLQAQVQPRMMRMAADMAAEASPVAMEPEAFSEYYRYKLPVLLTIDEQSIMRYALFAAREVPCRKEYRIAGDSYIYRSYQGAEPLKQKARVALLLENNKVDNLGLPLPAGRMRIYQEEASGHVLFAGEDSVAHTPVGEKVEISLGESFDVRAEKKQLAFSLLPSESRSGYAYESTRSIKLINSSPRKIAIKVTESMPGEWVILKKNFEPQETSAQAAIWLMEVAGGGEETLLYTVRVKER